MRNGHEGGKCVALCLGEENRMELSVCCECHSLSEGTAMSSGDIPAEDPPAQTFISQFYGMGECVTSVLIP